MAGLAGDVGQMRQRMRAELDRSDAARFDLKQGAGGLVLAGVTLVQRLRGKSTAH